MSDNMEAAGESGSAFRSVVGKWIAVCFSIFAIYSMATFSIQEMKQFSLFLAFTLSLTFIHHPLYPKKPGSRIFLFIDIALALSSFSIAAYIWIDYWEFIFRVGIPTHLDIFFSILTLLLVFEATRRAVGWPLLIIAAVFLIYTFFGQYLPPPLSHKGYGIERIVTTFFMTKNGIFGIPLRVTTHFIFLFIAFGAFFSACGGTQFFVDLATALFGKMKGGPAKVSIAVSGMMGTISGSAVANTVTTGTFTIPLMKRIGFEPHVAGAIEATASSGGALMPPVMGAAAFIMAEFLGVPYISVCKAALLPAILYYIAVFSIVHFYSLKIGIQGIPENELPAIKAVIYKKWPFFLPLSALVWMLIIGYSPRIAVLCALLATVIVSAFKKETRMGPTKILDALASSGMNSMMVTNAAVTSGIVIGVVLLTGIGNKITALVVGVFAGSLILALPFVMLASLLFGMGLPTVVCYVLLATTIGPSIVDLGTSPLAAHLFIFYFGMLCMVTPPVSFASYAGAAIANANPMKTGLTAWKFSLAGFLLPYMFVYDNALLLMGKLTDIVPAVLTALVGIVCLGSAIIGYLRAPMKRYERILFFAAAFLLVKPGLATDLIGLMCAVLVTIFQFRKSEVSSIRTDDER